MFICAAAELLFQEYPDRISSKITSLHMDNTRRITNETLVAKALQGFAMLLTTLLLHLPFAIHQFYSINTPVTFIQSMGLSTVEKPHRFSPCCACGVIDLAAQPLTIETGVRPLILSIAMSTYFYGSGYGGCAIALSTTSANFSYGRNATTR